jgi:UDP-2,3-diacylglucosamine pyrophosphatase LpxH
VGAAPSALRRVRCSMISVVTRIGTGVIRVRLPDDALLVFLSDTHIGGTAGSDIFESSVELALLLEDLSRQQGPVELVLAGDFLDLLRMEDADGGGDRVAATIARPEYRRLFAALRGFARAPGHRVVYVVGNHDAEVWWNPQLRRSLHEAGLVDVFGLSYAASFASLPGQLVYCEHGNQFDPTNAIADYANPLDTPVGAHVLDEVIRPIGSGAAVTRGIDLRQVRYVFPVAAHPGPAEWLAGRVFYRFLGQLLRWLLVLLAFLTVAYVASLGLAVVGGRASGWPRALRSVLLEATYGLAVLASALVVVFLIGRRTARDVVTTLASRFPWLAPESERDREALAIRRLLEEGRAPPMAGDLSRRELAVFVSGHTHAPAMSELAPADGTRTVIVNSGCWLRQLRPAPAWLGAPPVFVPAFVHTHVRVRSSAEGVTVELWEHPKPAERPLPWIERAAIAGRMPRQPPAAGPRVVARQVVARRPPPPGGDPR